MQTDYNSLNVRSSNDSESSFVNCGRQLDTNQNVLSTYDDKQQLQISTSSASRSTINFSFELSWEEYERIAPRGTYHRLQKPWCDIFYREFRRQYKLCALVFTYNQCRKINSRKRGSFWSGRAACRVDRKHCVKVVFTVVNRPQPRHNVEVLVTVRGTCIHGTREDTDKLQPEQPNRRFLKGEGRSAVAHMLRETLQTPASLFEERLAEMEVDEVNAGNTTHCQRKETFRQALYESHRKERLHDSVAVELDLIREAWQASLPGSKGINGFIHGVGLYPFYTIFYTEAQVAAYVEACKGCDSVMNLDSTGSVVTEIAGQKRPYYYCFYNASKHMPAFEFVTTRHNATWICSLFEMFREDAKMLNGRRAVHPRHVVTDFSFALIYAVLYSFNKQSLSEYMSFAYKVLCL